MEPVADVKPVSADVWSELLHAEVGALLGLAGIPCLHIKGPTVATWLYEPGDLLSLRAHVADLVGDECKRGAMGAAAHHAVRARTWPVVCDGLLRHYEEAAQRVVVGGH